MMRYNPELTMTALMIHNDVLHKARFENFGYVIGREGGESQVFNWSFWLHISSQFILNPFRLS